MKFYVYSSDGEEQGTLGGYTLEEAKRIAKNYVFNNSGDIKWAQVLELETGNFVCSFDFENRL